MHGGIQSSEHKGLYQQAYAGDAFNTAVCLKRCSMTLNLTMTVIGKDISSQFEDLMQAEDLSCNGLYKDDDATMGAYMVHLDDSGERSFSYWRKHSAATKITQHLKLNDLLNAEYVFFTGITLAILSDGDRESLLATLKQVADAGVKVVFDPNYRPRLWTAPEVAAESSKRAITSVALPGLEDFEHCRFNHSRSGSRHVGGVRHSRICDQRRRKPHVSGRKRRQKLG